MRNFSPFICFMILCVLPSTIGYAQAPVRYPTPMAGPFSAPQAIPHAPQAMSPQVVQDVLDVRVEGNVQVPTADILRIIQTRPGRPFSATVLEEDVRALMQRTWFVDVRPRVERIQDEGYIVTFHCIERQLIHFIRITGNRNHTKNTLLEEANIRVGDALDPIAIQQSAERMTQFYRESGFHKVHIEVLGGEFGDRGVVFKISEGPRQRVLSVAFEGNRIASDGRLRTLIQTKPGWFFWVNSDFTRRALDADVEALINYYRKLGFFYATVDRVFEEGTFHGGLTFGGQHRGWIRVRFIIDEGPRCRIRDIRFIGNNVFDDETLLSNMRLRRGQYYNQDALEIDMQTIREMYGDEGYVFAMLSPDPRVEQDFVDLVITIREGPRCFLETLTVEIVGMDGNESYTKWHPVLNRSSIRPGDLLRTSEINASRRRLMASNLFNTNPTQGPIPEFIFEFPQAALEMEAAAERAREAEREAERMASGNPQIRGQTPHQTVPFASIIPYFSPARLAEPTLRFSPNSSIPPIQTAPQVAPAPPQTTPAPPQEGNRNNNHPSVGGINTVRGINNSPPLEGVGGGHFPPVGTFRGQAPSTAVSSNFVPPLPAQIHPSGTSPAHFGSVVSAPAPLQVFPMQASPTQSSNAATAVGMDPAQYRMANTATILGNPFDTFHAPSNIRVDPNAPPGVSPYVYGVPGVWRVQETRTGSVMASIAVSSDAGLMGRFIYEEQNFDILNFPRGCRWSDWRNAFRGRGQRFRIEAVPGTHVQRYSASWESPHIFNLDYSFGVSGFYFQRYYNEWYEDRVGGSISIGKLWTPDFSTRLTFGGQQVHIYRPMLRTVQDLYDVLGRHPMYNIGLEARHNTRDSEFMPTEGHLISAGVEQILGNFQFIRGHIDLRRYFMLRERPDRSGRWVLGLRSSIGITEGNTPIFERYFGGGFTNLRGFDFRGVSPRNEFGEVLGGRFEFYNSAEMIFPLTADDMVRGSIFIDTGTVERSIRRWEENYRVAVGFGLRLSIPMMGPAPIALDFAFPLSKGRGDDRQIFSFGMQFMR